MRFGRISDSEARRRLDAAEEENRQMRQKLHILETASWADSVMECEGWRERALVAEAALRKVQGDL